MGSSHDCDNARILANPAIVNGVTLASVPPQIIISASPAIISLIAIPIASVAEAHAEVTVWFGPLNPHRMDKCPPAILAIILGTNWGDTRRALLFSITECCSSSVWIPPTPVPIVTPTRSISNFSGSILAILTASSVATNA